MSYTAARPAPRRASALTRPGSMSACARTRSWPLTTHRATERERAHGRKVAETPVDAAVGVGTLGAAARAGDVGCRPVRDAARGGRASFSPRWEEHAATLAPVARARASHPVTVLPRVFIRRQSSRDRWGVAVGAAWARRTGRRTLSIRMWARCARLRSHAARSEPRDPPRSCHSCVCVCSLTAPPPTLRAARSLPRAQSATRQAQRRRRRRSVSRLRRSRGTTASWRWPRCAARRATTSPLP